MILCFGAVTSGMPKTMRFEVHSRIGPANELSIVVGDIAVVCDIPLASGGIGGFQRETVPSSNEASVPEQVQPRLISWLPQISFLVQKMWQPLH
jgi:hypothetical protein